MVDSENGRGPSPLEVPLSAEPLNRLASGSSVAASGRCTVSCMSFEFEASGRSFYVPSAFYISAAHGVLDASDGSVLPGGWHRLMHEYGHLIQDRTSVFGAIEFMHFFDSIHSILKLLQIQANAATPRWARCAPARTLLRKMMSPPTVQLPVSATEGAQESWIASIYKLRAATDPRQPWRNGVMWALEGHRVDEIPVWYEGAERSIPVAVGSFVDNVKVSTYEHAIGPREIKEAYSVAIEVLHGGPPVNSAAAFEYLAVERILSLAGQVDERQVIAVCHWALQDPVPGVRFFEIFKMLEQYGRLPEAGDLYDLLRADALRFGLKQRVVQVGRQLDEIVRVQAASGSKDLLFEVLRWYRDRVVAALARNLDPNRRFPLDTYICGFGLHPDVAGFTAVVAEEPIPAVETPSGAVFAFGGRSVDSDTVLFIRSLGDLVGRLWFEPVASWPCVLESTCGLGYRDAGCTTRPCDKGRRRPACPYGAAAAYLGIPRLRTLP